MILVAISFPWFHSNSIFQRLYFSFVPYCLAIYFQCVVLCAIQTGDYKTAPWNSLKPCFHLENDTVFYSCRDHGFRYNFLLEFIKRYSHNYQKVILLNLRIFNYVAVQLFFCYNKQYIIIRNLFQKLSILKTELAVKHF